MTAFSTTVLRSWFFWIAAMLVLPVAVSAAGPSVHLTEPDGAADPGPAPTISETGPLRLTLAAAVMMALENNRALSVEKLNPPIRETEIDRQQAVFDPLATGQVALGRADSLNRSGAGFHDVVEESAGASLSLEQLFASGTRLALEAGSEVVDSSLYRDPLATAAMDLSITQALLRGSGTEVNTALLRQAELDVRISEYELKGFGETLVARVEAAYWDLALARRQVGIVEESLRVAEQQLAETEQMIAVGTMAEAELPAAQAEVALQHQSLIEANGELESLRLELLCLLNPPVGSCWQREVELVHRPDLPEVRLAPVDDHVAVALRMRPEIHQARLQLDRNALEVVRTKNGLLPRLDLFVQLGKTGFADSFSASVENLDGRHYALQAGLQFEFPPANRDARARHRRATLERRQAEQALANLTQLLEVDVRRAYIAVERTRQQIAASTATRRFQEEKNRIETEKFRVGRSTSFLVAQAQRDLLASRIAEVKAVVDYLKALTDLFRLDGSLLARRGLAIQP